MSKNKEEANSNFILVVFIILLIVFGVLIKKVLYPLQSTGMIEFLATLIVWVTGSTFFAFISTFGIYLLTSNDHKNDKDK